MTEKMRNKPVAYSIIFTLLISAFWAAISFSVRGLYGQYEIQTWLIISVVNISFAILAIALLGAVNQVNGFRHVFKTKGLTKGLLALIPVMVFFVFNLALSTSGVTDTGIENIEAFPIVAFIQVTSALMQNVLFRGLLITSLFVKLSSTEEERVKSVFKASALYLLVYIPLNIFDTGNLALMQIVNTFIVGAGFCAVYMYSRSIMSLVLGQGVWQVMGSVIYLFGAEYSPQLTPWLFIVFVVILILIVVFAVRFSKRAKPFACADEDELSFTQ